MEGFFKEGTNLSSSWYRDISSTHRLRDHRNWLSNRFRYKSR